MQNGKYNLLVVDVDGTLVGGDESISVENREALAKIRRRGMRVSLCTGRAIQACLKIIEELSLDGCHIFFDGALVGDPVQGEEVYVQPLNEKAVKLAVEFARSHNIYLELYSSSGYFVGQKTWLTDMHRQTFGVEPTVLDLTDIGKQERIIKGEIWTSSPREIAQTKSFCHTFYDSLQCSWARTPAFPDTDFINVLAPEVSKGKALKALASHLGMAESEVMVVGDGLNDVSLFATAGLAVAMGNAPRELKAVADHVTLDVDHSGLAAAIRKFLL